MQGVWHGARPGERATVGIEVFERAAEARARILRVEQLAPGGVEDPCCGAGFLLTFDVGRILVVAEPVPGRLGLRLLQDRSELAGSLRSLDEAEPWWRVLGQPLTRVWPGASGAGATAGDAEAIRDVRIQFREDDENPRVISLRLDAGAVCVAREG